VHLLDPDTGAKTDISQANPTAISGTRYYSSDDSIATVNESGLITAHQDGSVTISIVHLGSQLDYQYDDQGNVIGQTLVSQVIGQSNIALTVQTAQITDEDDSTPAPRAVTVSRHVGGVVSGTTGETVLIGVGALRDDTAVSIHRLNLATIEADVGMPLPAPGALEAIGAFQLDVGNATTAYPLQLVIPVQGSITANAGEEVFFLRKGQVLTPDGSFDDIWWLVDNGTIGTDAQGNLVARTASPPYNGVGSSGEYVIMRQAPGAPYLGGTLNVAIRPGDTLTLKQMYMAIGGGSQGFEASSAVLAMIADMNGSMGASGYHMGIPQFADIPPLRIEAGDTFVLDVSAALPPLASPYGTVVLPNITSATMTDDGMVRFTIDNPNPGQFKGVIQLRALFSDGTYEDVKEFAGDITGDIEFDPDDAKTGDPEVPFAIGTARWKLVRQIPTNEYDGSGILGSSDPMDFAGNTISITPRTDMAAYLSRTTLTFVRQDLDPDHPNLLSLLGKPLDLDGTYLTGNR